MSFLHPEILYYMLPPLVILFGLLLTQKTQQESFFSPEVMQKLQVSVNTLTLKARNALFFLIGFLMIIALAGPVIDEGKIEIKAKSSDIMIALDISDSMLGEDLYPNRLALAKQKALALLKLAKKDRIGVIAFAKNSYLVSPLSFDHDAVAFLLRSLDTNSITEKGTNFLSMLEVVDESIHNKEKKYLLILSDGGDSKDFSQEIAFAKEHNIVIFVLGIGTTKGSPIKREDGSFIKYKGSVMISKLNENIQALATQTGGVYIQTVNADTDIKAMLHEIELHSKKKELKSKEIKRYIPLFYYPLGMALLLLLIATSSMSKRKSVSVPNLFVLFVLLVSFRDADAGLLDFMDLEEAKDAYSAKEYKKAESIYKEYEQKSQKSEIYYNIGNALYKQGKYKEAVEAYKQAKFTDKQERAENFANLGNAYVKTNNVKNLEKAVEAYKESLKIKEDKEIRENLEAVKKFLEKEKQKKEQNKQKKNSDSKDSKKDKSKENKQKQEKSQKENKDQKNQENKEKGKEKEKSKEDKEKQKNKEQNKSDAQKQQEQEAKKREQEQKKEKQSEAEKKKNAAKELEDKRKDKAECVPKQMQNKMSDEEEKKWLKSLSKQQSTYLYRLNKQSKFEENENEKPW